MVRSYPDPAELTPASSEMGGWRGGRPGPSEKLSRGVAQLANADGALGIVLGQNVPSPTASRSCTEPSTELGATFVRL